MCLTQQRIIVENKIEQVEFNLKIWIEKTRYYMARIAKSLNILGNGKDRRVGFLEGKSKRGRPNIELVY